MAKSKFFRVAVAGATTDGRVIDPKWIDEMAASFNRETYGPRINMEHIRGFSADAPFNAYGDVVALEARDVEIDLAGKKEKRRALFAQIEPTEALIKLNRDRQKIYTSIEVRPNFAGTGKAGLVGLAVTDNPASLGTEALSFAAFKPMFAARKEQADDLFAEAVEVSLELEPEAPAADPSSGAFASVKAFFDGLMAGKPKTEEPATPPASPPAPANDNAAFAGIAEGMSKMASAIQGSTAKLSADIAKVAADHAALVAKLEATPGSFTPRAPASGGTGTILTDC